MKPSAIWLGLRVGLWLCALPLRLHWYGLPGLLARLTPQGELVPSQRGLDVDSVAWVTGCVCRRRLFHSRLFPRLFLRLAPYAVLSRLGYPAIIHVGLAKDGGVLHGHSWVTVHGRGGRQALRGGPNGLGDLQAPGQGGPAIPRGRLWHTPRRDHARHAADRLRADLAGCSADHPL
jgi:Transglutaminase-like superfamily